jgi:hypothetical protein
MPVSVSVVCYVGSSLCNELITNSEEPYQVSESAYDLETPTMRQLRDKLECVRRRKNDFHHDSFTFTPTIPSQWVPWSSIHSPSSSGAIPTFPYATTASTWKI